MTTPLQRLETALVNAHRAGDADAARKLAAAVVQARKDPVNQIPTPDPDPNVPPVQPEPERTMLDRAIGAGEAALTTVTGAVGGTIGALGGTVKGIADEVGSGNLGKPNRIVEDAQAAGAAALTYEPRTAAGRDYVRAVGEVAQELMPLAGLQPEMAALTRAIPPAMRAAGDASRAAVMGATEAAPRVAQTARALAARGPAATQSAEGGAVPRIAIEAREKPQPAGTGAVDLMPVEDLAATAKSAGEGGIGASRAQRVLAEQAAPSPETVKAAERLGIREYLQPDHVTTSEAFRQITAAIKSNPQSKLALAEREGLANVAQRTSSLIDELGGTSDMSMLSSEVKAGLRTQAARMESQSEMLHGKVRKMIPESEPVQAPSTVGFLRAEAERMGGASKLAEVSPTEARLLAKLSGDEPITYAYLDATRKQIGQALSKASGPFKDSETGLLKRLYASLSDDQEAVARQFGNDAFYTWQAAKYATRLQKGFEDDLVALFGRDLDRSIAASGGTGLPGAMRALAAGDSERLGRLLAAVPPEMRQRVVASGLSTVFRNAATRGEFDFTGYVKWYDGLRRNRSAYAAVMSNLSMGQRKQLEALYRVSKGVSESLNRRIKTGALSTVKAEMMGADSLMESLYSFAKRAAIAAPIEAGTSAVGLPGAGLAAAATSALMKGKAKVMQAVDELIASPEFEQLARTQPNSPAREAAVRRLAFSKAFNKLVREAGRPVELGDREAWIVEAMSLQGAQQGRQDNQQPTLH